MKSFISIACLMLVVCVAVEARPKRHVLIASPVVASSVVASPVVAATVPVVRTSSVVHSNPTTVVKTEQVHSGDRSSYSYSSEVQAQPVVHTTHTVAAAAAPVVSTVHHTVPTYSYGYYPLASYSPYYSPYHYVVGK